MNEKDLDKVVVEDEKHDLITNTTLALVLKTLTDMMELQKQTIALLTADKK